MSLRSSIATGAIAVLVTLSLAAAASPAPAASGWTRADLGAVTQPAPVGSRFVFYAHHGTTLEVVALNARDGSTAWTAPAAPSNVTPGVAAELAVRGDTVFYLAAAPGVPGAARVAARDVGSGRLLWQSTVGEFSDWPQICPDDQEAVCASGSLLGAGGTAGALSFSAASGKPVWDANIAGVLASGRELGPDIYDPGGRSPEVFAVTSKGRVAWRRPVSSIFTLPRASSDGGWNIDRFGSLFVGSIGTEPKIVNGRARIDLSADMTAGFTVKNGRTLWRGPGIFECGPLPCPGAREAGYSSPGGLDTPSLGLRMLGHGSIIAVSSGQPVIPANVSVALQGFVPATGKTRWSFAAGRNLSLLKGVVPPRIDDTTIVLTKPGEGLVALDLSTGKSRPIAASASAWCERPITYRLAKSDYYRGKIGMYIGQSALFPCSAGGPRVNGLAAVPAFVAKVGAHAGGMTAWTDSTAVHAVPSR